MHDVFLYMHVCENVCVCARVCVWVERMVCVYMNGVWVCECVRVGVGVCVYEWCGHVVPNRKARGCMQAIMYVCVYACMCAEPYAYMYVCRSYIYIYTHTLVCVLSRMYMCV